MPPLAPAPNPQIAAQLRAKMPVTQNWAYFDHAAVAPLTEPARDILTQYAQAFCHAGDVHWPDWEARACRSRTLGARLLGASPEEVALVPNTTAGIALVAEGFPWQPGDNVITLADEFPSNQFPWENLASRGVATRQLEPRPYETLLERLDAAIDPRTRIVALSWVGYASGYRLDPAAVAEVAHRKGALFSLDAIQGLGVFPLDVETAGVDFAAADGHKWMLGPEGAGLFYIRREHLDRLRPFGVGWNSVVRSADFSTATFKLKPNASRYEGGSLNLAGFAALAASLELLVEMGTEAVAQRILWFNSEACRRLDALGAVIHSPRDAEHGSGILSFELPGRDPKQLRRVCLEHNVVLSCRAGRLRISPHGYNDTEDLDRLIDALQQGD